MTRTWCLWLFAAAAGFAQTAAVEAPPPTEAEQKKILAQVTENALNYARSLPDFVCNQLTRRSVDASGTSQQWRLVDSIDEELRYIGHKESYRVVSVNGKKAGTPERRPAGATSWSEFGNLLTWIFDPKAEAALKWQSLTPFNKRPTHLFSYAVTQPKSQFTIGGPKSPVAVAFFGFVWADAETSMVVHVTLVAQSPAGYPLQSVTADLGYEPIKVGEQQFALPVKWDFRAKEGKGLIWNEVEFRRYRKTGADPADKFEPRK